jgi:hypothetical protein
MSARLSESQVTQKRCFQIVERVASLVNIPSSIKFDIPDSAGPEPEHRDDQLFSKFYYKRECYDDKASAWRPATGLGIQLIEPLFGMLRDPFDSWCGEDALDKLQEGFPPSYSDNNRGQSKNHIMPQGFAPYAYTLDGSMPQTWRQHGTPPWFKSLKAIKTGNQVTFRTPQVIHLDLGSSYFGGWSMYGGERNTAASGQWFYDTYQGRGNPFDRFTAVELEKLDPDEAFKQVPEDLIGKYSLMNIGLSMDKDKFNTLELIRRTVSEEDFFVFKLDIDSAPIEMPIVNALLADDPKNGGASALIDELMFEHHCKFYPMAATWNLENADPEKEGNLASSYKLFRDLRLKGIRAHSWP